MKPVFWLGAMALLVTTPLLAAQNSCERVKTEIEQKIIQNGVPQDSFSLTIVPSDQADQQQGQVVGHCANDTQKIVYSRIGSSDSSDDNR